LKYFLGCLSVLVSFHSHSQSRILLDSKNKTGVPYATIKVLKAPRGTVAAADGSFRLEVKEGDSILITSVGYEEKIFAGADFHDTIFLEPKYRSLTEVTIREKKFLRSFFAGNGAATLNNKMDCGSGKAGKKTTCLNWGPSGVEEEFAEQIELPSKELIYQVRKIYIPVKKFECFGPLLIRIYKTDHTGFPGELLLARPIPISKSIFKNDRAVIDLAAENIYIDNSKSFFISVGWLPEAAKQNCITRMIFPLATNIKNTFSRSLLSNSFWWQPIGLVENNTKELHANLLSMYAAELWEMR
jgi:hypothetical protein